MAFVDERYRIWLLMSTLCDRVYLLEFPEKLFAYLLIEALLTSSSNEYS